MYLTAKIINARTNQLSKEDIALLSEDLKEKHGLDYADLVSITEDTEEESVRLGFEIMKW